MSAFWRDLDVPQSGVCSLRGPRLGRTHKGIRTIDPASRLGRCRQFIDIGRAVRPCQSEGALRSQRHRQRLQYPAAQAQPTTTGRLLRFGRCPGAARAPRDGALCRRLATDHRPAPSPAKTARPAAGATGDEQFHGDLPRLLIAVLRGFFNRTGLSVGGTARNNFLLPNLFKVEFSGLAWRYRVSCDENCPSGRDGGE